MFASIERKCVELFGYCPLDIHDIQTCKKMGFSQKEIITEAAMRHYKREVNDFYEALCRWQDGKKKKMTREQARERNEYYKNAQCVLADYGSGRFIDVVDWMAFPKDDPTVCYYIGISPDSDMCIWAENYKK